LLPAEVNSPRLQKLLDYDRAERGLGTVIFGNGFSEDAYRISRAAFTLVTRAESEEPSMNPPGRATASPDIPAEDSLRRRDDPKIEEIVVFVDGRTETTGILEFAGVLAEEYGAHLTAVFLRPLAVSTPQEMFVRGGGIKDVIEAHSAQLERIEADHRARFDRIVRRHGTQSEWRSLPFLSRDVEVHAHYADLAVVARPDPSRQTAGPLGLGESLVFTSGRPVILFPPQGTASRVRRILVGWNAGRESVRAVADAMPLLVRAEAVEVLVVDSERRQSGHGQEPGADIARHLARHGVQVEVRRRSSEGEDVGRVLLSQAAAFGADLLVMGAYGHSYLNEWIFGGVTRTILSEAGLPVLMSR
jgi:nucleotide-binding universal stress UspA family protein